MSKEEAIPEYELIKEDVEAALAHTTELVGSTASFRRKTLELERL